MTLQLTTMIKRKEDAQQFLATVVSSDAQFDQHPTNLFPQRLAVIVVIYQTVP